MNQRERLIEGMIAAAARYGYGGASVARVIEQAGVSRATFYEQFADKEECFLYAYREVAARVWRSLESEPSTQRLQEVLAGLLANADRDPAAARLVLIESLAGGHAVREEHERLLGQVEEAIERHLAVSSEGGAELAIPARAVLGGVANVLAIRVFQGETGRLAELEGDLSTWLGCYLVPAGQRLSRDEWVELGAGFEAVAEKSEEAAAIRQGLPRGRGALPPGEVAGAHRDRIVAAVAHLARENGYAAVAVSDIVATAGVAREAFYHQFRNKEEAFLAAQSKGLEESLAATAAAFFAEGSWPDRVWDSAVAMLRYVGAHTDLAVVQLVESYAAGPAAIRRTFDARMAYTLFLEDGYRQRPEAERLPRLCSEAIAGGILEFLRLTAVRGETNRMLEILPQSVFVTLAPFIGAEKALELVKGKCGG